MQDAQRTYLVASAASNYFRFQRQHYFSRLEDEDGDMYRQLLVHSAFKEYLLIQI